MNGLRDIVAMVNGKVNNFVWGLPMLVLLVGTGILMTVLTKGFQLSHFRFWMAHTVGAIFKNKHVTAHTAKEDRSISQFQSLCTALAATIGTGNIAGVAAAIAAGGPGAIFWMWIVAIFGMMTNFSENVLGIYYRRKNAAGEWSGGAMYYLRDGLGSFRGCKQLGKVLGLLFSIFCIFASFGIGNMGQINSIATNMRAVFSIPNWVTGVFLMAVGSHGKAGTGYGAAVCRWSIGHRCYELPEHSAGFRFHLQGCLCYEGRRRRHCGQRGKGGCDLGHEAGRVFQ